MVYKVIWLNRWIVDVSNDGLVESSNLRIVGRVTGGMVRNIGQLRETLQPETETNSVPKPRHWQFYRYDGFAGFRYGSLK